MRCSQPSRPESRLPASRDNSGSPSPTCEKCWRQNLEDLEKADSLVPWLEPIRAPDYESGGQEFESLRVRHTNPCKYKANSHTYRSAGYLAGNPNNQKWVVPGRALIISALVLGLRRRSPWCAGWPLQRRVLGTPWCACAAEQAAAARVHRDQTSCSKTRPTCSPPHPHKAHDRFLALQRTSSWAS